MFFCYYIFFAFGHSLIKLLLIFLARDKENTELKEENMQGFLLTHSDSLRHCAETLLKRSQYKGREIERKMVNEESEESVYFSKRRWKKCSRKAPRKGSRGCTIVRC